MTKVYEFDIDKDELDKDIKVYSKVASVHGITEESDLELTITLEGIMIDLYEVTENCTGSSCECTETFAATFEELLDLLK